MTEEEKKRAERKSLRIDRKGHVRSVPDGVIAEWTRRRLAQPSSLTAQILGDPLPGYSALDRK